MFCFYWCTNWPLKINFLCPAAYRLETREAIKFDYDYSNGFINVFMHSVAKMLQITVWFNYFSPDLESVTRHSLTLLRTHCCV